MRLTRIVALVGMMGAGKSALGRRLADRLNVPFYDSDAEVVAAAGCTIQEIFNRYGEPAFRECERKVLDRLLRASPHILATGGGAFMDENTRSRIKASAVSMWIDAPIDVLLTRVQRRDDRPLLKNGDPREIMAKLLKEREPFYALADLKVTSNEVPHDKTVEHMMELLKQYGVCEEK